MDKHSMVVTAAYSWKKTGQRLLVLVRPAVSVNNYKVKQQLAEITHNSTQAGSDPLKSDRPDTVHLSPLARAVPVTSPTCQTGRMTS